MGKKLYEETQEGGICFRSERRPWEVRIPNYVYDLWMPVLGVIDIGIYGVYCRLERESTVKAISLGNIARACRIGKSRLYDINERLAKCGFIRIAAPKGWHRLAHHTTEITVLDPPQEVPAWAIKEYCQLKGGYQPLSPWLVEENEIQTELSDVPNGTPESSKQDAVKVPDGTPNVVTLGLDPLDVVLSADAEAEPPDDGMPIPDEDEPQRGYTPGPGRIVQCEDPDTGETVGEPAWRFPQTQRQHQAFLVTGRRRFRTKAEYNKMRRIERMLESGELPEGFWNDRKASARKHRWSFPKLLQYTLDEDLLRKWEAKQ